MPLLIEQFLLPGAQIHQQAVVLIDGFASFQESGRLCRLSDTMSPVPS